MKSTKKFAIALCSLGFVAAAAFGGAAIAETSYVNAEGEKNVTITGVSENFGFLGNGNAYRMWANMDAGNFQTDVNNAAQVTKVLVDGYSTKELKIEPYAVGNAFIDFDWAYDGLWNWQTDAANGKSHYFTFLEGTAVGSSGYTIGETFTIKVTGKGDTYHAEKYTPSTDGAVDVFFGDIQRSVIGNQYPNIEVTMRGINQIVYTKQYEACGEVSGVGIADGYVNCSPWEGPSTPWLQISDWSQTFLAADGQTNVGTYNITIKTEGKLYNGYTTDLSSFGTGHYYTLEKGLTFTSNGVKYRLDETVTFTNDAEGKWSRVFDDNWQKDSEITVDSKDSETTKFHIPDYSGNVPEGKVFIGWENNEKLYKAGETVTLTDGVLSPVCVALSAQYGASIRMSENYGMRFVARSDKSAYITESGALLAFGDELTAEKNPAVLEIGGNRAKRVVAEKTIETENGIEWRTAITDITVKSDGTKLTADELGERLATEFAFRAYIIVTYADESTQVFYTVYDKDANLRSMKTVAEDAIADTKTAQDDTYKYEVESGKYSRYTKAQYQKLQNYLSGGV